MSVLGPDDGERVSDHVVIKADHERLALTWSDYPVGERGPDAHIHQEHADCFYVLDGRVTFELGGDGELVTAGPGAFVLLPCAFST